MKIGLVCDFFQPHAIGGAERSAFYLGKKLAEYGHTVYVVTPNYGAEMNETIDGVNILRYPFAFNFSKGNPPNPLVFKNPVFWAYSGWMISRIFSRIKPDILHCQGFNSLIGSLRASRKLGVPLVHTIRDYQLICASNICLQYENWPKADCNRSNFFKCLKKTWDIYYCESKGTFSKVFYYLQNFLVERPVYRIQRNALINADKIIAISQYVKEAYVHSGIQDDNITVVYNLPPSKDVVASSEFIKSNLVESLNIKNRWVVLVVGKLSIGKGTLVMFKAAALIGKAVPDTLVLFAGKPAMDIRIPPESQPFVKIAGSCTQEEVMALNKLCNVSVVPGIWPEPFGRVLYEAMSAEKPIVATNVGGKTEAVIHGINGFLVERHSPEAIAEPVVKLLKNIELANQMGKKSKIILERCFSEELILKKVLNIYEKTTEIKKYNLQTKRKT